MRRTLPEPKVLRCYFDEGFQPHLPAMCLQWDTNRSDDQDQVWILPQKVHVVGPPPNRFGIRINRQGDSIYAVRLLWNRICFTWQDVPRARAAE